MQLLQASKALAAANPAAIAASQTLGAAGPVTLNGPAAGGVPITATLDTSRRVIITSAGNDTGVTFTVTGTSHGVYRSEQLTGASGGAAATVNDFDTITSITASGATSAITVGTSTTGSTRWMNVNPNVAPFSLDVEISVTGAVTYSVEYTLSDLILEPTARNPTPAAIIVRPTSLVNQTTAASYNFTQPMRAWRVTITAGTGTVTIQAMQSGIGSMAA